MVLASKLPDNIQERKLSANQNHHVSTIETLLRTPRSVDACSRSTFSIKDRFRKTQRNSIKIVQYMRIFFHSA